MPTHPTPWAPTAPCNPIPIHSLAPTTPWQSFVYSFGHYFMSMNSIDKNIDKLTKKVSNIINFIVL